MKVLVIGSGGQLGTDCLGVLGTEHQVLGLDFPDIDLGSRASIARAFEQCRPEAVINCAAYTAVDKCETEREAAWKINAEGPGYLAEAAAEAACRVIHISTDYVFDGTKPVPGQYLESDPVNPLSEYGRSKLAGESAVSSRAPDWVILRTAWLYSASGPNFLKTMLRLALSRPDHPFTIVNDQYGSLTWSYTLARQIGIILETDLRGIVHATSTGYCSWYEAACYFLRKMEVPHGFVPCTTAEYPTPAHRPANSILENRVLEERAISVFGPWQDDLDQFVKRFRDQLLTEARAELAAS